MAIQVIHADSLEYLRTLPENSLHACITDPPYGLGVPPDPMEVLAHWAQFGDWKPKTKGGTVLDPFAGSGSLGVAVVGEGNLSALLIEREADYHAIATARVDAALRRRGETLDESWFEGSDLDLDSQGSE